MTFFFSFYLDGVDPKSDEALYRRNVLELVEKVKLTVYGLNELEIFYDSKGNLDAYKDLIDQMPQLQRKQLPHISKVHQSFLAKIGGTIDSTIFGILFFLRDSLLMHVFQ